MKIVPFNITYAESTFQSVPVRFIIDLDFNLSDNTYISRDWKQRSQIEVDIIFIENMMNKRLNYVKYNCWN